MSAMSTTSAASQSGPEPMPGNRHDFTGGTQPPAASREPLVSARDLSVGYSDQPVCAPATFDLLPGQVLALVGVNGAGKSTILRTCCGLLRPLAGRVHVLGHVPDPRSGAQRAALATDLGQESFFPTLTVAEHLRMVCFGHGVVEADERVSDLLEDLGCDGSRGTCPRSCPRDNGADWHWHRSSSGPAGCWSSTSPSSVWTG